MTYDREISYLLDYLLEKKETATGEKAELISQLISLIESHL